MPSLLVIIFVLEVVSHLVNTIGAAAINNLVRLSLFTVLGPSGLQVAEGSSITNSLAALDVAQLPPHLDVAGSEAAPAPAGRISENTKGVERNQQPR